MAKRAALLGAVALALAPGCGKGHEARGEAQPSASVVTAAAPSDDDDDEARCTARVQAILAEPAAPGAPGFEANRVAILGRARGEPMVFVRAPRATPDAELTPAALASRRELERGRPGIRVHKLAARHKHDPATLRALTLREGYVYAEDPLDALALVTDLAVADLFVEAEVWRARGGEVQKLVRQSKGRETSYRLEDGANRGRAADLLFGDRLATSAAELALPLHRDLRALTDELGASRATLVHATERAILADLRFGERTARSILDADGPKLRLGCLAAGRAARASIAASAERTASRRRALARLHDVVTEVVDESPRFDRPEGETGPDRDGELRPFWATAYLQGRTAFDVDGATYYVFDQRGRPTPPEVCVDFVLDAFERASGTWFRGRGERPARVRGRLDFDASAGRPRGVVALGRYAEEHPELFSIRRFEGAEKIRFGERERFFAFLTDKAELEPGDVVSIQGMKRDDRIHQHAILVERVDPLSGFPYGLADQMKRPRRRTWEGIMAEAPARSLFYRARPVEAVLAKVDPGPSGG